MSFKKDKKQRKEQPPTGIGERARGVKKANSKQGKAEKEFGKRIAKKFHVGSFSNSYKKDRKFNRLHALRRYLLQ